jgi:hypothetical protein
MANQETSNKDLNKNSHQNRKLRAAPADKIVRRLEEIVISFLLCYSNH